MNPRKFESVGALRDHIENEVELDRALARLRWAKAHLGVIILELLILLLFLGWGLKTHSLAVTWFFSGSAVTIFCNQLNLWFESKYPQ